MHIVIARYRGKINFEFFRLIMFYQEIVFNNKNCERSVDFYDITDFFFTFCLTITLDHLLQIHHQTLPRRPTPTLHHHWPSLIGWLWYIIPPGGFVEMDNNYSTVETFCPNEETRIPISGKEFFTCCVRFSSVFCPLVEKVGRPQSYRAAWFLSTVHYTFNVYK